MLTNLLEFLGSGLMTALVGLVIGLAFGACAQQSRFCMRAAVIESATGKVGERFIVWLLAFSTAILAVQLMILSGALDVTESRQLSGTGSISGALIGGAIFGAGMILARGCSSRILILSATGNLRALVTGLVLAVVAQASLTGVLSPARQSLAELWTISGGEARDLMTASGLSAQYGLLIAITLFLLALSLVTRRVLPRCSRFGSLSIGMVVALAWTLTYQLSLRTFDPTPVQGISFVGPSADTLVGLISAPVLELNFDAGLIPGVFVGSLVACILAGEFRLQGFDGGMHMIRYLTGGALMGFGGMLAGGCTVGAALSGSSVFALTAYVAMASMWVSGAAVHLLLDWRGSSPTTTSGRLSVASQS